LKQKRDNCWGKPSPRGREREKIDAGRIQPRKEELRRERSGAQVRELCQEDELIFVSGGVNKVSQSHEGELPERVQGISTKAQERQSNC